MVLYAKSVSFGCMCLWNNKQLVVFFMLRRYVWHDKSQRHYLLNWTLFFRWKWVLGSILSQVKVFSSHFILCVVSKWTVYYNDVGPRSIYKCHICIICLFISVDVTLDMKNVHSGHVLTWIIVWDVIHGHEKYFWTIYLDVIYLLGHYPWTWNSH